MSLVFKRIKQVLKEKHIEFEECEHEPVYTSEQAAKTRGLESAKVGVKAMILKADNGNFILVLNPGDKRIDTKKIAKLEGVKKLSLAKPDEVQKVAGVKIGCVGPFGLKTKLKTYLNEEILENEYVYFNPGMHTITIRMRGKDLLKVLEKPVMFR